MSVIAYNVYVNTRFCLKIRGAVSVVKLYTIFFLFFFVIPIRSPVGKRAKANRTPFSLDSKRYRACR